MFKTSTKKKNLNPNWSEIFSFLYSSRADMDSAGRHILCEVYDYDFGQANDLMGNTLLDISRIKLDKPEEITLPLAAPSDAEVRLLCRHLPCALPQVATGHSLM